MEEILSAYVIKIKGSSYYTLAQFFSEFYTCVKIDTNRRLRKRLDSVLHDD